MTTRSNSGTSELRLVARIGDDDTYHYYDTLEDVAEAFFKNGIREIEYKDKMSVEAHPDFIRNNYISLYWAHKIELPDDKGITEHEVWQINQLLTLKYDAKMKKKGYNYVIWPANGSIKPLYVKTIQHIADTLKSYADLTFLIRIIKG